MIQNASNGMNALKSTGKRVIYVTNNSVRSVKDFEKLFKSSNIQVDVKDIVNPLQSIIEYLQKVNFKERIYCISNELLKSSLQEAGFEVIDDVSMISHIVNFQHIHYQSLPSQGEY